MRALSYLLVSVLLTLPYFSATLHAQTLPHHLRYQFIFDDFLYYKPVDYIDPYLGTGGSDGSLFGNNPWIVSQSMEHGTVQVSDPIRAWYAWLWPEHVNFIRTENPHDQRYIATTSEHGTLNYLTLGARHGDFLSNEPPASITSGFLSNNGTWMTKAFLTPLPALKDSELHNKSISSVYHAFWLQSSNYFADNRSLFDNKEVFAPNGKSWSEINFEIWNSFPGSMCNYNPTEDPFCTISTGVAHKHLTYRGRNPVLRAHAFDTVGTCRVGQTGQAWHEAHTLHMNECFEYITNVKTLGNMTNIPIHPKDLLPTYFFIQIADTHFRQEIYVIDEEDLIKDFGWLYMSTHDEPQIVPPHPMRTVFSLEIFKGYLPFNITSIYDYIIYTPRVDKNFWELRGDVGHIQGFLWDYWHRSGQPNPPVIRMNTTNLNLSYPHISRKDAIANNHACFDGIAPYPWQSNIPRSPFTFTMSAHQVANTDTWYFSTRPVSSTGYEMRHTDFSIEWTVTESTPNGVPIIHYQLDSGPEFMYHNSSCGTVHLQFDITYTDLNWHHSCSGAPVVPRTFNHIFHNQMHCEPQPISSANDSDVIEEFSLYVSPHPLRDAGFINYSVTHEDHIVLSIYDVTGRLVITMADRHHERGRYQLPLSTKGLGSGIYLIVLQSSTARLATKALVIR